MRKPNIKKVETAEEAREIIDFYAKLEEDYVHQMYVYLNNLKDIRKINTKLTKKFGYGKIYSSSELKEKL